MTLPVSLDLFVDRPERQQWRCTEPGCTNEVRIKMRGLCNMHWKRWRRSLDPSVRLSGFTESERFWAKVDKTDGCWLWTGGSNAKGYGSFTFGAPRVSTVAHRYSYITLVGPIPEGLELDHLCRNRKCVNPAHLEPVTHAENVRRGESGCHQAAKDACPQGHPYDEANTYRAPGAKSTRSCRICRAEASRRHYLKSRGGAQ